MADESLILNDKGVAGLLDPDSAQDQKERLESMERRLWAAAETFSGQPIELILRPTQPRCPNAHRYVNGVKQPCPDCTTGKQGEGERFKRLRQWAAEGGDLPADSNLNQPGGVDISKPSVPSDDAIKPCPRSSTEEQRTSKPRVAGSNPAGGSQARSSTRRFRNESAGPEDNPITAGIARRPGRTEEPGDKSEVPAAPEHATKAAVDVGGGLETSADWTYDSDARERLDEAEVTIVSAPAPQPSHVEGHSCSNCDGVDPDSCFGSHVEGEAQEPMTFAELREDVIESAEFFLSSAERFGDPEPYGMRIVLNRAKAAVPSTQHPDIQGLEEDLGRRAEAAQRKQRAYGKGSYGATRCLGKEHAYKHALELVREHFSREGERP